uniref:Uncharacterized protein n=1 Tax=Candidatus Kentrum sp. LPFa TaxID=2126335 RepID=A0A450W4R0_9GAMM|nr:MAG: hypothetical protein BECKLPF1236B_GA0070989_10292 [Candidatus Kentron sp. LPFa]
MTQTQTKTKPARSACFDAVRTAMAGKLEAKDIEEIIDLARAAALRRKSQSALDNADDMVMKDMDDVARDMATAATLERRNMLLNIQAREGILARVAEYDNPGKGMAAVLVGERGKMGLSVDARAKALQSNYVGGLLADLEAARVLPKLRQRDKEFNRLIARELWEIRPDKTGKPGITGSRDAQEIARVIHKWQGVALARQNRAGAAIREMPGYIVRQRHDMIKIRKAGMARWMADTLPKLDAERTFGDADPAKYLESAYEALASGIHLRHRGAEGIDALTAFRGPGNLARRLSEQRVLHFKSADDWYDYHLQYGSRDLMESAINGLQYAASNTALMETFGTNPRAMFDLVLKRLQAQHRGDPKKSKGLKGTLRAQTLDWYFMELDGATRIPQALTMARYGQSLRALQSVSKMGSAVLSAVADVPVMAAAAKLHGASHLRGYATALRDLVRYRGNEEGRRIAELIGVGYDGFVGDVIARFDSVDGLPGFTSRAMHTFFKLNLLGPWTDAHKTGMGMMFSRQLAQVANDGFSTLPKGLRRELGHYKIGPDEWDLVRSVPMQRANGLDYLVPEQARRVSDADLRTYRDNLKLTGNPKARLPEPDTPADARSLARLRDDLETRFQAYFVESVDAAVPTPGARERAFLHMGTQSGTLAGEAIRFMMQFKAFPITMVSKILPRVGRAGGKLENTTGLLHLIPMMTVFGYLGLTAQDISRGKTPRDPSMPATWGAAFTKGGGAGLYGDFLFANYGYGRGIMSRVHGPSSGTLDDLSRIYGAIRRADDAAPLAFRTLVSNLPGNNLFYTKAALDYLLVYRMQELLNPGYLRRMERRTRSRHHRYILRPSEAIR